MKKNQTITLLIVSIAAGIISGLYYSWLSPARNIEGVWSSNIYHDTPKGEMIVSSRLVIEGRELIFSGVVRSKDSVTIEHINVTMTLVSSTRLKNANIFTVNHPNPYHNKTSDGFFIFKYIQPKFYVLDCNNIIIDMEPGNEIGYTAWYQRVLKKQC